MKASDLKRMISEIVRIELRKQLPAILEKVMVENYIRKIASESASASSSLSTVQRKKVRHPTLAETLSYCDELDESESSQEIKSPTPPRPRSNPLLDRESNPLAFIYEGVKPLDQNSEGTSPDSVDISSFNFDKIKKTYGALEKLSESKLPMKVPPKQRSVDPVPEKKGPSPMLSRVIDTSFPEGPVRFDE